MSDEEEPTDIEPNEGSIRNISNKIKELLGAIRGFYEANKSIIGVVIAISAFLIQTVFDDEIERLLPAIFEEVSNFLTSNAGITVLGLVIVALQAWELKWIHAVGEEVRRINPTRTDGGDNDLPPRDEKGRFTSSDSGPSIIFVIAVLLAGYLIGSQFGDAEAVVGALVAFLLLIVTDNI